MESHEITFRNLIEGAKNPEVLKLMEAHLNICDFLESDTCQEDDVLWIGLIAKALIYEVQRKRMRKEINFESTTAKRKTGQDSL